MQGLKPEAPRVSVGQRRTARAGLAAAALAAGLAALMTAPMIALAQSANQESVEGRGRPEYEPLGIYLNDALTVLGRLNVARTAGPLPRSAETLGSFIVNTTMELETTYDDNIFRQSTGQVSDVLARFKPGIRLSSDWANHAFGFSLGGDLGRYADHSTEDFSDFNAGINGKIDVDEGENLDLSLAWSRGHEARDSLENQNEVKPTTNQNFNFSATYNRDVGEIFSRTTLTAGYADVFDNGTINNDDRDVRTYTLRQRLGHEVDEGSQIFIEGAGNLRDYVATVDDNGKKLGSHGVEGLIGLVWDVSGVSFLEFGAGYFRQEFNDPSSQTSKGPSFRGRFLWNPTGLLTLSGSAAREVKETAQAGASGVVASTYSLKLDWEALYNLILTAEGGFQTEVTGGINRSDDTARFALRARWLMGENWSLRGAAEYAERTSSRAGANYSDMRLTVAIVERL